MKSTHLQTVLLLTAFLGTGQTLAQDMPLETPQQESRISLPAGATLEENGAVELPSNAAGALWLNFYSGIYVALDTTSRLHEALSSHGFKFTQREEDAKATVNVTGFVRMYNATLSYDTGQIYLGELLEQNIDVSKQSATVGRARGLLDSDAGVAQQATRAINAGGGSGGVAAGIGAAVVTDWLADATGLRGALNNGFRKLIGARGNRPIFFCGVNCKRTIHEVVLQLTVWQGREPKAYNLILRQVADDINDDAILPLAKFGLSHLLDKLYQASRT
jgi:hypothetical protein